MTYWQYLIKVGRRKKIEDYFKSSCLRELKMEIFSICILRTKQSLLFFLTYKLLLLKLGPDAYNKTEHMDQFSSD